MVKMNKFKKDDLNPIQEISWNAYHTVAIQSLGLCKYII